MIKAALRRALPRPCPDRIPRSGDAAKSVNCFAVFVNTNGEPYLLVESSEGDVVKGRRWEGNSFSVETEAAVADLVHRELEIIHWYGGNTITYKGAAHFLWHRCTGLVYLQIHLSRAWEAAAQFLFNRRSLRSEKRLRILGVLVSKRLSGDDAWSTYFDIMTELYSMRWIHHPAHEARSSEVRLQLESLEASNDVERDGNDLGYRATARALATLEQAEEEERRHREAFWLQFWIVVLTAIIAVSALVEAGLL